jgi:Na+-transporting methylmalonyl-CoA/oxaloacetate decarboxylase gamma subunit
MLATVVLGLSLLHLAVYGEAVVIVLLLVLVLRVGSVGAEFGRERNRARRERDEARETLATLRRMSEIRVETVTRMRGFQ